MSCRPLIVVSDGPNLHSNLCFSPSASAILNSFVITAHSARITDSAAIFAMARSKAYLLRLARTVCGWLCVAFSVSLSHLTHEITQ